MLNSKRRRYHAMVNPRSSITSRTALASGLPWIVVAPVARSTLTDSTPGSLERFFSTMALQWPQVIPFTVMVVCCLSIGCTLFGVCLRIKALISSNMSNTEQIPGKMPICIWQLADDCTMGIVNQSRGIR